MTAPVTEGDILDGKYRIDQILGRGGMGMVVSATNTRLNQKVAIKFLLPEALEHPDIVARFGREGEVAAKLHGQHVVRIIDVHEMPDGRPYIVMEHLSGEDLEHVLDRIGCLPPTEAVTYMLQACEALAEAHSLGIIHRDLKPANLFLARQPDRRSIVKILDFGISKVTGDAANLTRTATAMGTPFYMSPEQLMNAKDVDARSDIWALGVIFFELLTGVRPFEGASMPEIVAHILRNERPTMRELRSSLPDVCDEIATKCLQNDRSRRFETVEQLAQAIASIEGIEGDFSESTQRIGRLLGRASLPPGETLAAFSAPQTEPRRGQIQLADTPPTAIHGGASGAVMDPLPQSAQLRIQQDARPDMGTQLAVSSGIAEQRADMSGALPAQQASKGSKSLLPMAIGGALFVALLGGGVAFVKSRGTTDPTPVASTASNVLGKDPPALASSPPAGSGTAPPLALPTATATAATTASAAPSATAKVPLAAGTLKPPPASLKTAATPATATTSANPLDMKVK